MGRKALSYWFTGSILTDKSRGGPRRPFRVPERAYKTALSMLEIGMKSIPTSPGGWEPKTPRRLGLQPGRRTQTIHCPGMKSLVIPDTQEGWRRK